MPEKSKIVDSAVSLRCRAERRAKRNHAQSPTPHVETDIRCLLHELEVHQIELEMQNAELRRARDEAETLRDKYTDLYDFSPVGYFTLAADGTILLVNLAGSLLTGIGRSKLAGSSLPQLLSTDLRTAFKTFLTQVFEEVARQSIDTVITSGDGPPRIVNVKALRSPNGQECHAVVTNLYQEGGRSVIQCSIRDITARKDAEEITRRSGILFSSLIDQAPVGICVVSADFRLQQANPTAMAVFQNVHPLIGRDLREIMRAVWPPRVADQIVGEFRHTLQTGEPYRSSEFSARRRDIGVKEVYEWQVQRVTLPANEYGVVCFFENITERTKAEAARRRMEVMSASNLKLKEEIVRRQAVEGELRSARLELSGLLKQSRRQEIRLRNLSRRMLHVQEDERKRISRELHDVIVQTLVGINVHLAALASGAEEDPRSLKKRIAGTHALVEKAVDVVHRFARELRPPMLDELGLIPTLQAFMKHFMEDTGVRVGLKAFAGIEQATDTVRTVLFRVAQEALTNVACHAKASRVDVNIQRLDRTIRMEIKDDGQGFDNAGTSLGKWKNRLGLVGMKERVEMMGGAFCVESAPGEATTIRVDLPDGNGGKGDSRANG